MTVAAPLSPDRRAAGAGRGAGWSGARRAFAGAWSRRGRLGARPNPLFRKLQVLVGAVLFLAGLVIMPLPGPFGLPIMALGLVLVLRNSLKARRQFVRAQRRHPKAMYPLRRMLRRNPRVVSLAYAQVLKLERLLTPGGLRRYRLAKRIRREARLRRKAWGF